MQKAGLWLLVITYTGKDSGLLIFVQLPGLNAISGSFTSKMMLCVTSLAPCMVRSRKQRTSMDWKLPLLVSAPDLCLFQMVKKGEENEQA